MRDNAQVDLISFVNNVLKPYCELGPREQLLFDALIRGKDLAGESVPSITLDRFENILLNASGYLEYGSYATGLLVEVSYLRGDLAFSE